MNMAHPKFLSWCPQCLLRIGEKNQGTIPGTRSRGTADQGHPGSATSHRGPDVE